MRDGRGIVLLDAATGRILRVLASPAQGFQDAILVPAGGVLYARFMGRVYAIEITMSGG